MIYRVKFMNGKRFWRSKCSSLVSHSAPTVAPRRDGVVRSKRRDTRFSPNENNTHVSHLKCYNDSCPTVYGGNFYREKRVGGKMCFMIFFARHRTYTHPYPRYTNSSWTSAICFNAENSENRRKKKNVYKIIGTAVWRVMAAIATFDGLKTCF